MTATPVPDAELPLSFPVPGPLLEHADVVVAGGCESMSNVEHYTTALRGGVKAGNVEVGVVTRRGVSGQGDYALGAARKLLAFYNDYFGQPYPMPKMDHIAGPGSSQFFGAMENWGAIFYFESELLFDPARATTV